MRGRGQGGDQALQYWRAERTMGRWWGFCPESAVGYVMLHFCQLTGCDAGHVPQKPV